LLRNVLQFFLKLGKKMLLTIIWPAAHQEEVKLLFDKQP